MKSLQQGAERVWPRRSGPARGEARPTRPTRATVGASRPAWRAGLCALRGFVAVVLALAGLPGSAAEAVATPAHVGSAACVACHAPEAEAWAGSDHALAWTLPSEATVLGDFDDASFQHGGVTTRFFRDGGAFMIETEGADGERRAYPVVGVAGVDPLQQYLLSPEPGRTQVYDIGWDVRGGRWYPVFPNQAPPPGDGMHWTGPYRSWEGRCAECHATGYRRNYDPATRTYAPEMTEIGVGCESCHGPGAAHVAWAADPARPSSAGMAAAGLTVDLGASAAAEIAVCFACHSRREAFADGLPVPGTGYHDAYALSLLREGTYHANGAIQDEVFEAGSFLQSKMHARGVRCSNCHEPHAATLRAEGNAVCAQCHSPAGNPDFPSLRRAEYDTPDHHFHSPGTTGAQCKSCHMVERVYMGVDARRDHAFRIPRPDLSAETRSPDACTDCHADRDPAWAAAAIAARFPDSARRGPHFSTTLAAARWSPAGQAEALLALASDPDAAGIVRATALALLASASDPALAGRARPLLGDADPLVRAAAAGVQRGAPPPERLAALLPALRDPVRAVRIAAAAAALDATAGAGASPALAAALAERSAALGMRADFPEGQLQAGGAALTARDWSAAIAAFREAVALDPQLVDGWSILVRLLAATGDMAGARAALAEARAANPGSPALAGFQ